MTHTNDSDLCPCMSLITQSFQWQCLRQAVGVECQPSCETWLATFALLSATLLSIQGPKADSASPTATQIARFPSRQTKTVFRMVLAAVNITATALAPSGATALLQAFEAGELGLSIGVAGTSALFHIVCATNDLRIAQQI